MQKGKENKIRLGVFVTASMVLLIAGIYLMGQKQKLFNNSFHIRGVFKDISGLQIGNNVRFAGINVGIIENIQQISDSTVQIDMLIDEGTKKFMKKNVKASISSDGIMGSKIVIIIPGERGEKEVTDYDLVETIREVSMDDILENIKVTGNYTAKITDDLTVIMDNIRKGKGTVGKLFMDSLFAENINQTLLSIKQGAGGFKQNMEAASHNVLLKGFLKKKDKEKEPEKKPD